MNPTQEISLIIPVEIMAVITQTQGTRYVSERIRELLSDCNSCPEVDLSDLLKVKAVKKNLYMSVNQAKSYRQKAGERGQSVSTYLVNLMANKLSADGLLCLEPRWSKGLNDFLEPEYTPTPRFLLSKELLLHTELKGISRPFDVDLMVDIILEHKDYCLGDNEIISVEGFYFNARDNKDKINVKMSLPPKIDNILTQLSLRMGTSRNMVMTQALLRHLGR